MIGSRRGQAIVAIVAGVAVAGGVTAIAATHGSTHRAKIVAVAPAAGPSTNGNGFTGRPGLGGPGLGGPDGGGPRFGGGFGPVFGGLSVAATYLGVSETKLQTELANGKTLAQAAKDHGKTSEGLVSAMVAATRNQLDAIVSAGRFSKQQENLIVSGLEQRFKALVNGTLPNRGFGRDDGGGGLGGAPGQGGAGSFGGATTPA